MKYAQTNLQLYTQLGKAQYSNIEIVAAEKSYNFAMEIFSGQFRPTMKPFVCHLVGTASILVSLQEPIVTVLAGLLHASYSHGDFGDGTRGFTTEKQKSLRAIIGEESEKLIAEYTGKNWNVEMIRNLQAEIREKNHIAYAILTIRLADVLEDSLDLGIEYSQKRKKFGNGEDSSLQLFQFTGEIAHKLGHHELASELEQCGIMGHTPKLFELQGSSHRGSFVLAPQSHRVKFQVQFRRLIQRGKNRLSKLVSKGKEN